MGLMQSFTRRSFSHGIHPPEYKGLTRDKPIRRLPFAPVVLIPLSQHVGAPARPIVRAGQEVVRGEPIAEAAGFMSVPHHAPATGVVDGIELVPTARGPKTDAILLRVYPGSDQQVLWGEPQDIGRMSPAELVQAVQATGMVSILC
jgi:Na+-translocating ferredoxin:NAD+ oxidoreductase subunit C